MSQERDGETQDTAERVEDSDDLTDPEDVAQYALFPVATAEAITPGEDRQSNFPEDEALVHDISLLRAVAILTSLAVLLFLQASNISMLTTTQGVIAAELDAFESTSWFTSSYLVAMSSAAPLSGRLSHIFAPRWCIFASGLITATGVTISGFARDLPMFLAGRAITGTGAAGIFTVAIILVVQLTTPKRRGIANGILNTIYTIGVAAGAVVAGLIEPAIGWRALFWLQAPLAASAGLGLLLSIPASLSANPGVAHPEEETSTLKKLARIDYLGAILLVASIVSLLYSLSTPHVPFEPILASLVFFPLFLYREVFSAADPIIPISVLSSRGALLSCLSTLGFMMARWSVLFYAPMYATAVRGWSPASAGSMLVPTNTGFALGSLIPGFFHIRRTGSYWGSCLIVYSVFPLTLAALALESTHTSSTWGYVLCIFANGFCAGAAMNYTLAHVLHLVRPEVRFIVTSLVATFRGFAGTFGSAVGGGIFTRIMRASLYTRYADHHIAVHAREEDIIRQLLGSPRIVGTLKGVEHEIAVGAYEDAIKTLFLSGAALACVAWFVQAGTGWTGPSSHKERDVENNNNVRHGTANGERTPLIQSRSRDTT